MSYTQESLLGEVLQLNLGHGTVFFKELYMYNLRCSKTHL
jgi:hypothetical protein